MPNSGIDFRKELNDEQYAVVTAPEGPAVVLAGAGSGKTRTIVYRVAYLLQKGVRPEEILLLTFTNKAAAEMMSRIGELAQKEGLRAGGIWGGTFHSIANRILRTFADRVGYSRSFTILDQDDAKSLIKACIKERGVSALGSRFPSPTVVQELISYCRNAMVPIDEHIMKAHPSFSPFLRDLLAVAERYAERKKTGNAMDFDDLLTVFLDLLTKDPRVAQQLSNQFRAILVDEYQDTNPIQAAVVGRLAEAHRHVLVVGDDAQSIYSFRAADIRNILDFKKRYPDASIYTLVTNYRSTPQIVDLANSVIEKNVDQYKKELVSVSLPLCKPTVMPSSSAVKEAAWVAEEIGKLARRGVPEREIAVLFRSAHHSQSLEFELAKRGVAYEYRGGLRFFDRAHTKDALAFVRLMVNVTDEAAWLRILSLQEGIGETTALKCAASLMRSGSLAEAAEVAAETILGAKAARGWRALQGTLAEVAADPRPSAAIRAVIASPYAKYLEAEYPNFGDRLADLEQLAVFADGYENAVDFLADASLDDAAASRASGQPEKKGRLVLSTIHQAKGLEWDAVFVIHLTNGGFPNRRAMLDPAGLEEERRLFYVAVTRARKYLHLSYPASVGFGGSFSFETPSLFLEEIEHVCIDWLREERFRSDAGYARPRADDADSGGFYEDDAVSLDGGGDDASGPAKPKKRSFLRDV